MSDYINDEDVKLAENIPVIDYAPANSIKMIMPGFFGWSGYVLMWIYLLYLLSTESWRLWRLITYVPGIVSIRSHLTTYVLSILFSIIFVTICIFLLWPMIRRKANAVKFYAAFLMGRFLLYLISFVWAFLSNCITSGLAPTMKLYGDIFSVNLIIRPFMLFVAFLIVYKSERIKAVFAGRKNYGEL